ncbi:MAG: hypothetical protein QOJ38_259 [Solirubrobacterales bacterium]|nr:hypothetical protein [Solirubrobacterales bacterium]
MSSTLVPVKGSVPLPDCAWLAALPLPLSVSSLTQRAGFG